MRMIHSQYLRIETMAGGCTCSAREFIRAARTRLKPEYRIARKTREARQAWIRSGLDQLKESKRHYLELLKGRHCFCCGLTDTWHASVDDQSGDRIIWCDFCGCETVLVFSDFDFTNPPLYVGKE